MNKGRTKTLTPPLKWAGGKRWLLPHLLSIWQEHSERRLVEPFCGGLAVALGLNPDEAVLNDVNPHLINFYQWVREELCISIHLEYDKELFYKYREEFNDLILKKQERCKRAAELFYYLNRTGYNGLCRFNSKGLFNVPFGSYKRVKYVEDFSDYSHTLSRWEFTNVDFQDLSLKSGDFIYADPPYDVQFREYSQEGFSWDDQVRLAGWLSMHSGPVIASNQATDRIIDLYGDLGFEIRTLSAPRRISCKGDRTPAQEMLALKNM